MGMMANVRCRCGTEIEIHHQRGDIAMGLASSLLAVHEREAHSDDHGAGSSTGESGCDDTDVAGSSPAQPQPSDEEWTPEEGTQAEPEKTSGGVSVRFIDGRHQPTACSACGCDLPQTVYDVVAEETDDGR